MNRRAFFGRVLGAFAAAYVAPSVLAGLPQGNGILGLVAEAPVITAYKGISWRGIPVVSDPNCHANQFFLVSEKTRQEMARYFERDLRYTAAEMTS